jgi:hypothetical protein
MAKGVVELPTTDDLAVRLDAPQGSGIGDALRRPLGSDARIAPLARLGIGVLLLVIAFCVSLLVRAAGRGLDLTDEGIYLNIYRAWRHPDLTFTGAPIVFGPVFQLLGWSIPGLRLVKLVSLIATSAILATVTTGFAFRHLPPTTLRREKQVIIVLVGVIATFAVYAWLPQSPGYNELSIMLSSLCISMALMWSMSTGRKALVCAALLGFVTILLFLVKWPSAICTSAGITGFIFASGRRKHFVAFVVRALAGGALAVMFVQVVAGGFIERVRVLGSSSDTILKGAGLIDAYLRPYLLNIQDTAHNVALVVGPVMVPALIVALLLIRRRPFLACSVYAAGLFLLIPWARHKQFLSGGEVSVVHLESTFPIFFTAALGVIVLLFVRNGRNSHAPELGHLTKVFEPKSLVAGLALVSLAPLLQAVGTGNPMFRIAYCAGGAWATAVGVMMLITVERGGKAFMLPALAALLGLCAVGLLPGIQGFWTDSFRVGQMWKESHALPGVPELKGVKLDETTAGLINDSRAILTREGFLGKPGFSTSNGTGLTYALGMPAPLAGLFVEEPLPNVLRVRIREACRLGYINSRVPPVVLSIGDQKPKVAAEELHKCGVDFPNAYRSERVAAKHAGYVFMRDEGITIWLPKS